MMEFDLGPCSGARGWSRRRRAALLSGCVLALAAGVGGVAVAQDEESAEETSATERLVVTGTRIQRSGFSTPTPVTVIDRQSIDDLGIIGAGEILRQLPMNNAEVSATATSTGSLNGYVSDANIGAELANLRGLNLAFGTRTLTLVDGHRFVPSTNGGAVDVGLIPANLILRTETVTGGASAAYGSDAVAGVVNIALDHDFVGIRGQVDFSETFVGDGEEKHVGLAGGWELFGDRGHLIAGAEWTDSGLVGQCTITRDWCRPWAIFEDERVGTGSDTYFLLPNATGTVTPNGTIINVGNRTVATGAFAQAFNNYDIPAGTGSLQATAPTFYNKQLNAAGTALVDWQTGALIDNSARLMAGGEGLPPDTGVFLRVPVERESFYARFDYDLTNTISAFLEASYGLRESSNSQATLANSPIGAGATLIRSDNAFLSPAIRNAIAALPAPAAGQVRDGIYINQALSEMLPAEYWPESSAENETTRFVAGFNGDFEDGFLGDRNWQWDTYYTYGVNEQAQQLTNLRRRQPLTTLSYNGLDLNGFDSGVAEGAFANGSYPAVAGDPNGIYGVANWDLAIDAVIDPVDGALKCRVNSSLRTTNQNNLLYRPISQLPLTGTGVTQAAATAARAAGVPALVEQCLPLNVLGETVGAGQTPEAVAAALAWALGTQDEDYQYIQHVIGANVQGEVFDIWSGPVIVAGGFEYRDEEGETTHSAPVTYWSPDYGSGFAGTQRVLEGYLETDFSLVRDLPFVQDLAINAAVRRTKAEAHDDTPISLTGVRDSEFEFTTWKVSGSWEVNDYLRFRATRSRDIRAPSFRELYFPGRPTSDFGAPLGLATDQTLATWTTERLGGTNFSTLMGNPWVTAATPINGVTYTPVFSLDPSGPANQLAPSDWAPDVGGSDLPRNGGGNPELIPETADTTTLGVVFQPGGAFDGFSISVDGYRIELADGIANVYTNGLLWGCYSTKEPKYCDRIVLEPDPVTGIVGDIYSDADANVNYSSVNTGSSNVNEFRVSGVDVEVAYTFELSQVVDSWGGNLTLRSLTTYMDELLVENEQRGTLFGEVQLSTFAGTNYAGQVGSGGVDDIASFSESPNWQGSVTGTYDNGPFRTTLQANWVGEAKLYNDLIGTEDSRWTAGGYNTFVNTPNEVGSYINWTWSGAYNLGLDADGGRDIEIFGVINNLFDRAPEIAPPLVTGAGNNSGGGSNITNATFYDSLGRRYRVGVRFRF